MATPDKITLNFSVKNPQKDCHYQIKVFNEDLSLGQCGEFETEDKKCLEEKNEIIFEQSIEYNFYFDRRQKIKFKFVKKIREGTKEGTNYKVKEAERKTTLSSLITSLDGIYERPLNKNESTTKDIFCIKISKINNKNNTIFDYLISGLKLSGFLALDFSNGKNNKPLNNSINKYKEILIKMLDKVSLYIKDHTFYVYGYGGKLKNLKINNPLYQSIFNINMTDDNKRTRNEELIQTFNKSINNIIPDKEVHFSSLIRKMTKEMYLLYDLKYYYTLFILARELPTINDKQETIDVFIESSYLPLTIIIICEGKNDFNKMDELYGNKIKRSSNGMDKLRNNIRCINFSNDFNDNSEKMIEWCLREISQQIIEFYYKFNKCTPEQIKLNKKNSVKESVDKYKSSIWLYESRISLISQNELQKEDKNENKDNEIPNYSLIYEQSKNSNASNQNKIEKKDEIETPGKFSIPTTDSIMPDYPNPYNKINNNKNDTQTKQNNSNNQKYTPEGPINSNYIYNKNNQKNQYIDKNNPINPYKEKGYRITPGDSVLKVIEDNPYQKQPERKEYKITPEESINPNMNYNPYQNSGIIETPHGTQNYIIPKNSIIQENKNLINPYNNNNKNQVNQNIRNPLNIINKNQVNPKIINPNNKNQNYGKLNNNYIDHNKINNKSGQSEFISNNNSNIGSIKGSNYIRLNNYSIDSSQIK